MRVWDKITKRGRDNTITALDPVLTIYGQLIVTSCCNYYEPPLSVSWTDFEEKARILAPGIPMKDRYFRHVHIVQLRFVLNQKIADELGIRSP